MSNVGSHVGIFPTGFYPRPQKERSCLALDRFDMVSWPRFLVNRVLMFIVMPFFIVIPFYANVPQSVGLVLFWQWMIASKRYMDHTPLSAEDCFHEKFFKNLKRLNPYPGLIYITGFAAFPVLWMLALNWAVDLFSFTPFLLSLLNIAFFILFLGYISLGSRIRAEIYKVLGAYAYSCVGFLYPIRYLRSGTPSGPSYSFRTRTASRFLGFILSFTFIYVLVLLPLSVMLPLEFLLVPPFLSILVVSTLFKLASRVSAKNLCGNKVELPRSPGTKGGSKTYVFKRDRTPKPTLGIKILGKNFIKL